MTESEGELEQPLLDDHEEEAVGCDGGDGEGGEGGGGDECAAPACGLLGTSTQPTLSGHSFSSARL